MMMIKRFTVIFTLILFLNIESFAINNKLSLEIARIKQIERVILRVNSIYEYINLFIMQTAEQNPNSITMAILNAQYTGLVTQGYNGVPITFTINNTNNVITFSNVITGNSSNIIQQVYRNSPNLHPFATVLQNLTMQIPLNAQSIQFINYAQTIANLDTNGNLFVQDNMPQCTQTVPIDHTGRIWYQPDFNGDFIVRACITPNAGNNWPVISNKVDVSIFMQSVNDLGDLRPPAGTKAYANDNLSPPILREYIYDGNVTNPQWRQVQ